MIIIAVYLKNTGLQLFLSEFLFTTLLPIQHSHGKLQHNVQHFLKTRVMTIPFFHPQRSDPPRARGLEPPSPIDLSVSSAIV